MWSGMLTALGEHKLMRCPHTRRGDSVSTGEPTSCRAPCLRERGPALISSLIALHVLMTYKTRQNSIARHDATEQNLMQLLGRVGPTDGRVAPWSQRGVGIVRGKPPDHTSNLRISERPGRWFAGICYSELLRVRDSILKDSGNIKKGVAAENLVSADMERTGQRIDGYDKSLTIINMTTEMEAASHSV